MTALAGPVDVVAPPGEERPPRDGESPEGYVSALALAKAHAVASRADGAIVVGADTAVVVDGEILGKPADPVEANRMLGLLRGRTHMVLTGVTVFDSEVTRWRLATKSSAVTMRRYSDGEISAYVATGEPFDKAGGYAVQDPVFRPAQTVEGCYLNVVGLPLCEALSLLEQMGHHARLGRDWEPPTRCKDCPLGQHREAAGA